MDGDLALLLSVYEGHGLTPQNGWNVVVVARLQENELATSPVPLVSQPKFEVEMSWTITSDMLCMLRNSGVSVQVECLAQQQQGGQHHTLGYALLPLPLPDPDVKMEAQWYSLKNGPHTRAAMFPSLLLGLNLKRIGFEVLEDFISQKPKQNAVEVDLEMGSSSKDSKLHFVKASSVPQETDMFSRFRKAGEGSGNGPSHKRLSFVSKEIDEIQLMEESNERHDAVITEDDKKNNECRFNKYSLQSKGAQSIGKSFDSTQSVQEINNSLYGNSVPGSPTIKGALLPVQSRRSLQQSASISSSVKENGHRTDPKPSSSKINDVVALPSTSGAAVGATEKLRAIPLLNAQGSYFQIGPAGEPGEQMFEYSVTIVFAKFLDQLVPPDMEIREPNNTMFCYSLLSHFVYGEPIKDLANPDFQAENAMGRICSTVHNLSEYFMQHPDLPINLTVGDVCLATATVRLSPFASSILTGGLPVQVEGSYPLVPNLFSPLGWKPSGEPVVGIIVTLSASIGPELPVLPFSAGVRDVMNSDRGFHPMLDCSSGSSTRSLSDSQEDSIMDWVDQKDGPSHSRNHGTVARLGYKHKSRHKTWHQMAPLEWSAREAELHHHLAQEWESQMSSMENQLQQRLEQCHTLHKRLTEGLHALESRERSISLKEETIKTQKEDLKLRKAELKRLLKEVDKISKKERKKVEEGELVNLQQQLIHEKRQRRLLQRQVRELEETKRTTESTVDALRLGNQIKDEDINVLKRDKERLQEELTACSQRKDHYKMQWVKAVHQLRADVNTYRVDVEKSSSNVHQTRNSIQYKDERQNDRRHLRSLPEHKVPEDDGRKDTIKGKFTDSSKFVKDLINERKGLRNMVSKRKRIEEENESEKDDEIKVLSSPSDVRRMMHSLVDR
ncbi:hypothetical protein O3P69_001494 [Scylla paramamosain]|uniref:DUF3668 domain-containing protein n=1 Tax=Scylla paramamosain TaxID=85552 RepID=A0AAW0UY33_SCYPA